MRVPRFQAKVPSEGSEGSEVKVPCQASKKFQLVRVTSEGSEVPSEGSVSSAQRVPSKGSKQYRFRVKFPKVPVPSEGSEGSK